MLRKSLMLFFATIFVFTSFSLITNSAEEPAKISGTQVFSSINELDHRPLDPALDPDIDMFMRSWKNSIPYNTHGNLCERSVFTRCGGDPLKPQRKGAVLELVTRFSRATLDGKDSTIPTTLKGEQEILYITSGKGIIKTGKTTAELHKGIFVLIPANIEFTISNTSEDTLCMYVICEPIPANFRPNDDILVKDENAMTFRDSGYLQVHWSHNGKNIFNVQDGLGTLELVNLLTANAMTIGQPHSHGPGVEEVWTVMEGLNLAFIGKEIRWQEPGTAYKIPPTGYTPHSNINSTEEPVKFLYFARFRDHELRK